MNTLVNCIARFIRWLFSREAVQEAAASAATEAAGVAIDGFDKYAGHLAKRLKICEDRIDECESDRRQLRSDIDGQRSEIRGLDGRLKECEADRKQLHDQANRHSRELERFNVAGLPKPPHRSTHQNWKEAEGEQ